MEEVVVLDLLSKRHIPIKVCYVCCVLFEQEPTMSSVVSPVLLLYIFVSEELNVDVFVGIGVFNPISPIFCVAIPMSKSGDVSR